ncbi:MAG: entericidin A/B family lipoprotein [Paracoccus sp. (in: a-proteobacteria)]|uniref:entericidin A/B family lipoprotein n=1 Tax=Paracoccus sp. TaxID=267 RepID=UPI0039E54D6D
MRRILPWAMLIAATMVSACETMQGAGRDMQSAGALLTEQAANSQTQIGGSYTPPAATPQPY